LGLQSQYSIVRGTSQRRPVDQSITQHTLSTGDSNATIDRTVKSSKRDVDRRHNSDDMLTSPERQAVPWITDKTAATKRKVDE